VGVDYVGGDGSALAQEIVAVLEIGNLVLRIGLRNRERLESIFSTLHLKLPKEWSQTHSQVVQFAETRETSLQNTGNISLSITFSLLKLGKCQMPENVTLTPSNSRTLGFPGSMLTSLKPILDPENLARHVDLMERDHIGKSYLTVCKNVLFLFYQSA
jgi:hypothetical protein